MDILMLYAFPSCLPLPWEATTCAGSKYEVFLNPPEQLLLSVQGLDGAYVSVYLAFANQR